MSARVLVTGGTGYLGRHAVAALQREGYDVRATVRNRARSTLADGPRLEIVEGAGHFLHVEQPAVVNQLILDFVAARP